MDVGNNTVEEDEEDEEEDEDVDVEDGLESFLQNTSNFQG